MPKAIERLCNICNCIVADLSTNKLIPHIAILFNRQFDETVYKSQSYIPSHTHYHCCYYWSVHFVCPCSVQLLHIFFSFPFKFFLLHLVFDAIRVSYCRQMSQRQGGPAFICNLIPLSVLTLTCPFTMRLR